MEWLDKNRVQIVPPKKPKKLTGTRFATILGLNPWSTPFEVWCEVTRTYAAPFEDTIYTKAGKIIEPKQAAYMKKSYFMTNLVSPLIVGVRTTSRKRGVTSSPRTRCWAVCGTTTSPIPTTSPPRCWR